MEAKGVIIDYKPFEVSEPGLINLPAKEEVGLYILVILIILLLLLLAVFTYERRKNDVAGEKDLEDSK